VTGKSSCYLLAKDEDAIMDNMKFRVLDEVSLKHDIHLWNCRVP